MNQEKRLNSNLSAEIESCRRESRRINDSSSLTPTKNQLKEVIILESIERKFSNKPYNWFPLKKLVEQCETAK